ncbi:cell wall hydrolase [Aureimonas populi]|uniref:Cell wall hydrolase n=1 Tax=Aureimonas populi TaxID=1701758 RepID=A0ABW5CRE5_9HYPH
MNRLSLAACLVSLAALGACQTSKVEPMAFAPPVDPRSQECLARAMYFESIRSSREGMLAVGSVVMNRVDSEAYPDSVCAVVSQANQFAPGVMTRAMGNGKELAMEVAKDVLSGARHKDVEQSDAMFFHTAGLTFGYGNMNYVAIAGGNAFYERVRRSERKGPLTTQADLRAGRS